MDVWCLAVCVRITLSEWGSCSSIGGTTICGMVGSQFESELLP